MRNVLYLFFLLVAFISGNIVCIAQSKSGLPQLVKTNGVAQLFVQGKPFLILGGELGNSSTSNLDYMRPIWPKLRSMNLNTVLAPVYWELMEPVEGQFDFTLVDTMIAGARRAKR